MQDTSPVHITRTWKLDLYGGWGDGPSARVHLRSCVVTLSGEQFADRAVARGAQIDGQDATVEEAVRLLAWARDEGRVTLLSEVRDVTRPHNASTEQAGEVAA